MMSAEVFGLMGPGGCVYDASNEISRKVQALVGRLRVAQSLLADESAEVRREQLDGEISRAIKVVSAGDRETFLRELLAAFPTFEGGGASRDARPAPVQTQVVEVVKPRDLSFEELVESLAKQWGGASPEQRARAQARLAPTGLGPSSGGSGLTESQVAKLRQLLTFSADELPQSARVLEISMKIIEFVLVVDAVAWGTWGHLAPSSAVRRNGKMQRFLKEYLTGPGEVSGGGTTGMELDRLRELCRALTSSIAGDAPQRVADRFGSACSPGAIEESIPDSAFRSKDAECWKTYKARVRPWDQGGMASEIKQAVVNFVEDWMRKPGL